MRSSKYAYVPLALSLAACTGESDRVPGGFAIEEHALPYLDGARSSGAEVLGGSAGEVSGSFEKPSGSIPTAFLMQSASGDSCAVQDGTPMGDIGPVTANESIVTYYSYNVPEAASYNGAYPTISNDSMVFIYEDSGTGERSLVIVHDQPNDGFGGQVQMSLSGLGAGASVSVADDPGQEDLPGGLDGLGNALFRWNWAPCCTDGVALSDVDFDAGCVSVAFDSESGIDTWSVVDGATGDRIDLDMTVPVEICPQSCDCVADLTPPSIECPPDQTVVLDPDTCEATVAGEATGTDECDGDLTDSYVFHFTGPGSDTHTYTLTDSNGNFATCDQTVTAVDETPPVFTPGPAIELWAPNHKYVEVTLARCGTATDACSGELDLDGGDAGILSVTSSEPDDVGAGGDGHTTEDAVIVDDHTAAFRGERQGAGDGRAYTIAMEMRDASGNGIEAGCQVNVPHDQGD